MNKFAALTACLSLAASLTASAANVAWVSFHSGSETPSAGAAGAGFTRAPDAGYTDLLGANGHTVTRFVSSATPDSAALNTFDLVIISRSVGSANYQNAGAVAWNSITAPMMIMGGYTLRGSRMGFTSGETIPDSFAFGNDIVDTMRLTALVPAHPIFAGVALDGSNLMVNPFATEVTFGANVQAGISVNTSALAGGGTLLAKVGTVGDPANSGDNGGMIIGEWEAGSLMGNAGATPLGGDRLVFLSGSRERVISSEGSGIFDLNADGSRMFLNAVDYMAVPEPSSSAVLGLAGAAALLRRRRR